MRIAVDAMGGDFAPREIVRGAINYAAANADEVILVGDVPRLESEIDQYGHGRPASVSFADAPEVIGMGESPATALRSKRRASIRVATDLVRATTAWAEQIHEPWLLRHSLRTWAFGWLFGQLDVVVVDAETLYLACLLHDVGLTADYRIPGGDAGTACQCFAAHGAHVSEAKLLELVAFVSRGAPSELIVLSTPCAPNDCVDAAAAIRFVMEGGAGV